MEETQTPVISREFASKDEAMLPVRAEAPITVIERRRGPHPAIYLAAGMLIGVGGTAIALRGRPAERPQLVVRNDKPASTAAVPRVGAQTMNPNGPADPVPGTAGALVSERKEEEIPSKANPNEPLDPFANGMVLPSLPPNDGNSNPFRGMILPERLPVFPRTDPGARKPNPLDDIVAKGLPKAPPALKIEPDKKEATPPGKSYQSSADDLVAYAAKLGGNGRAMTEGSIVTGAQITVPDKALADVTKHAAALGATVIDKSSWNGNTGERSQRLAQEAESKLASLKKLREALLVTYLEDAQPVKDVDADIAETQKAVDDAKAAKPAVEKMTVIRFTFGK